MADRYNGWTNYETENLKLWIDNDQGLYAHWQEVARAAFDHTSGDDDIATRKAEAAEALAGKLETHVDVHGPLSRHYTNGFYTDLMTHAIRAVNYREIAESLIEDLDDD
jgi:hypothetical protein